MDCNGNPDPEQLLVHARRGDRESLGALLDLYRNYLQLLARTQIDLHLRGRVSPSDLVQEVYLRACDRFDQFRGRSEKEWLGWLRRIVVHTLVHLAEKHRKARRRDLRREVSLEQLFEKVDRSYPAWPPLEFMISTAPTLLVTPASQTRSRLALRRSSIMRCPRPTIVSMESCSVASS